MTDGRNAKPSVLNPPRHTVDEQNGHHSSLMPPATHLMYLPRPRFDYFPPAGGWQACAPMHQPSAVSFLSNTRHKNWISNNGGRSAWNQQEEMLHNHYRFQQVSRYPHVNRPVKGGCQGIPNPPSLPKVQHPPRRHSWDSSSSATGHYGRIHTPSTVVARREITTRHDSTEVKGNSLVSTTAAHEDDRSSTSSSSGQCAQQPHTPSKDASERLTLTICAQSSLSAKANNRDCFGQNSKQSGSQPQSIEVPIKSCKADSMLLKPTKDSSFLQNGHDNQMQLTSPPSGQPHGKITMELPAALQQKASNKLALLFCPTKSCQEAVHTDKASISSPVTACKDDPKLALASDAVATSSADDVHQSLEQSPAMQSRHLASTSSSPNPERSNASEKSSPKLLQVEDHFHSTQHVTENQVCMDFNHTSLPCSSASQSECLTRDHQSSQKSPGQASCALVTERSLSLMDISNSSSEEEHHITVAQQHIEPSHKAGVSLSSDSQPVLDQQMAGSVSNRSCLSSGQCSSPASTGNEHPSNHASNVAQQESPQVSADNDVQIDGHSSEKEADGVEDDVHICQEKVQVEAAGSISVDLSPNCDVDDDVFAESSPFTSPRISCTFSHSPRSAFSSCSSVSLSLPRPQCHFVHVDGQQCGAKTIERYCSYHRRLTTGPLGTISPVSFSDTVIEEGMSDPSNCLYDSDQHCDDHDVHVQPSTSNSTRKRRRTTLGDCEDPEPRLKAQFEFPNSPCSVAFSDVDEALENDFAVEEDWRTRLNDLCALMNEDVQEQEKIFVAQAAQKRCIHQISELLVELQRLRAQERLAIERRQEMQARRAVLSEGLQQVISVETSDTDKQRLAETKVLLEQLQSVAASAAVPRSCVMLSSPFRPRTGNEESPSSTSHRPSSVCLHMQLATSPLSPGTLSSLEKKPMLTSPPSGRNIACEDQSSIAEADIKCNELGSKRVASAIADSVVVRSPPVISLFEASVHSNQLSPKAEQPAVHSNELSPTAVQPAVHSNELSPTAVQPASDSSKVLPRTMHPLPILSQVNERYSIVLKQGPPKPCEQPHESKQSNSQSDEMDEVSLEEDNQDLQEKPLSPSASFSKKKLLLDSEAISALRHQLLQKGKLKKGGNFVGHKGSVNGIKACNGKVYTCSEDTTCRCFSLETLSCLHVFKHPANVNCLEVCRYKDQDHLFTGCSDNFVRIFNLEDNSLVNEWDMASRVMTMVAGSKFLFIGLKDKIGAFHLQTSGLNKTDVPEMEAITAMACGFLNGTQVVAIGSKKGTVAIHGVKKKSGHLNKSPKLKLFCSQKAILGVAINGSQLYTCGWDSILRVFDVRNGQLLKEIVHDNGISSIHMMGGGSVFVSSSLDGLVHFYDSETYKLLLMYQCDHGMIFSLSSANNMVLLGCRDGPACCFLVNFNEYHSCLWADCTCVWAAKDQLITHLKTSHIKAHTSKCKWKNCFASAQGSKLHQHVLEHISPPL